MVSVTVSLWVSVWVVVRPGTASVVGREYTTTRGDKLVIT
jgi:predicted small integral membrane protein